MKWLSLSILGIFLLSGFGCKGINLTTRATPNGAKLRPAQDGPVRSALGEPEIQLDSFQLHIDGLVEQPQSLNWNTLLALPPVYSDTLLMYCVEGWEVWGNWKGILIQDLLNQAQVAGEGKYVRFHCLDGYTTALPIAYLKKYRGILAYEVNGNFLTKTDGFPLRVVAFGKFGYKWAKWVTRMEILSDSQIGYWENHGYSDRADVPLERRKYYEMEFARPLEY
jgi:DMSO/TMAO reductase YedYZ molybdopterin-dependent catalytic subunit